MGPTAMMSLLIPEAASKIAEVTFHPYHLRLWLRAHIMIISLNEQKGTTEYVEAAFFMSAISGILLLAASLCQVGVIVENLLSHPVRAPRVEHSFLSLSLS